MQIGTTTVPFLPLAAVGLAVLLVGLVLWGVRRARRHPAPAAVPGARPAVRTPDPVQQPCDADWTGAAANGYVTPPVPVERPRTVADIVAQRGAETSPMPLVGPGPAARPSPALRPVRQELVIDPGTRDAMAAPGTPPVPAASADPETAAPDAPRENLSAPSDERPDIATMAALHGRSDDTTGPGRHAVPDDSATTADQAGPEAAQDPVPPPWSAARSEPVDSGLEPSDDELAPVSGTGSAEPGTGAGAEPVSRAVQQALAARAVQRARRQRDDSPDEAAQEPSPAAASEQGPADRAGQTEYPLTVVASGAAAVATGDARDRLLSVLLSDPARAVGATEDLDDARDRIDQLGDVLRRRRADLIVAVRRLHDSGLDREQIGRLAGMGGDDVASMLDARAGDGADGPRPT